MNTVDNKTYIYIYIYMYIYIYIYIYIYVMASVFNFIRGVPKDCNL